MRDIRQTKNYAQYLSTIGWKVAEIDNVYIYIKKLPVIGSFIKIQRPQKFGKQLLTRIDRVAREHKAYQMVVEPKNERQAKLLTRYQFKLIKKPFIPSKTLVLPLNRSQKLLLSRVKKNTRYCIKHSTSLSESHPINDISRFHQIWKKSVPKKRYVMPIGHIKALKISFQDDCLLLASHNFKAGSIFLKTDETAYYWQAFADKQAKKANIPYALLWEGILWAKKRGAQYFDFEGIYDERFPIKSWKGFSYFKKGFGGTEVSYPGAFSKIRFPIQL